MIKTTDLLSFNFYKKEKFTGSYKGMRYLIQKNSENEEDVFEIFTWPGPYNFASTHEDKKTRKTFPFQQESLNLIAEYLNNTYKARQDSWPTDLF